jgi:hypothetical protein
MSHGLQFAASYTYSHALDEQSGLGLFYNGNNPLNLRDGYASSDFDRTHVINFTYVYKLPDFVHEHNIESYFTNGWSLVGLTVLQSGQPYSVIDFSGAVASVFYGVSNGITNPIVPLAPGCNAKNAKTGDSGAFFDPSKPDMGAALKSSCFTIPLLQAGGLSGAIPTSDPYETDFTTGQRNIFRQAFQKRWDASLMKQTKITERFNLKYTFDVFNVTNTASFDVPGNEVSQNENYNGFPAAGTPVLPTACNASNQGFYNCPAGLGQVTHTIGSNRQIQMSLKLVF